MTPELLNAMIASRGFAIAQSTNSHAMQHTVRPVIPTIVVNVPEPHWGTIIAVIGTLVGVVLGGVAAYVNARLLDRRKEQREGEAARKRVRFLLVSEFAAFGPYAGGVSLTSVPLLEKAHERLRKRWNDDNLILVLSSSQYEEIDATINQAERTIEKIKNAVKIGIESLKFVKANDAKSFLSGLVMSYVADVETTFQLFKKSFEALADAQLAESATYIHDKTRERRLELEAESGRT